MSLENLKKIMKLKGYTPETLSEKSGIPKSTIDKILCGVTPDPRYNTVKLLANALDLTTDELAEYLEIEVSAPSPSPSQDEIHTIAAHHNGKEWTDDEKEEIERFKEWVLAKRKQK